MSIVSLPQHLATRQARPTDPAAARRQQLEVVSEQFEALFLQQILKQMRKAGDALSADNPMRSRELSTMRDFYDEVLADTLAEKRQTGIADMLVRQLSGESGKVIPAPVPTPLGVPTGSSRPVASLQSSPSLASTWQRGIEAIDSAWERGKAGFMALVDSVIKHESAGNVAAVSPKGARGLMQLMPGTARDMAAELGIPFDEARLTSDAAYNKRLGTAYLNKMLDRYDGHQALALAAYNAGPGKVDEWLKTNGDPRTGEISTHRWVQKIPFAETRNYARNILDDLASVQPVERTAPADRSAEAALGWFPQASLNSGADPVALPRQQHAASAVGHQSGAFAQPIRLEPKEMKS
ncbi:transglycosylase SLT domain-containing protein [Stutzerimonas urumqiensis]|uniref:lytic transglycosylase domain-containing protein n=1 Tax=Stutzerimonas urumqiensis TaxID=638269 RepID=UPI003DA29594